MTLLSSALARSMFPLLAPSAGAAKPTAWERNSGKIVGVYVLKWQPTAILEALHGDIVCTSSVRSHVYCPSQLPEDAPNFAGESSYRLGSAPVDDRVSEAFTRLNERASYVKVVASVGGQGDRRDGHAWLHALGDHLRLKLRAVPPAAAPPHQIHAVSVHLSA